MSPVRPDFDIAALYGALDAERQARRLTWQQLAREISAPFRRLPSRPVSPLTLSRLRSHRAIEGDGVLQMLRWLDRTPESFVPGEPSMYQEVTTLPDVGPTQILRFDTPKIHAMLDARRTERALTWTQVAREIGDVTPAGLTRYAKGGRTGFPQVTRIASWLRVPVGSLTRGFDW